MSTPRIRSRRAQKLEKVFDAVYTTKDDELQRGNPARQCTADRVRRNLLDEVRAKDADLRLIARAADELQRFPARDQPAGVCANEQLGKLVVTLDQPIGIAPHALVHQR